jgi:hypothetical protein
VSSPAFAVPAPELVLDRYRPLRPIGRGGSGSVWLARDERSGLEVALKIVPREGKRASRAAREMEAASRLRHKRCIRAYDFGGDSGHVYIAYEYVHGQTMREALRQGRLNDREVVEAAAQILDGLAHAHAHGIIHRDVKPSNVLIEESDELSLRVLDFGLAQFDDADTLTAVGDVPGTLAYISPERLRSEEATAASDIWAVGVILWEALAGQHPFWGVPLPQVAATIEAGAPPLRRERPHLPGPLLQAVDRALSTNPERRPSAEQLARDLRSSFAEPRKRVRPATRTKAKPAARSLPAPLEARIVPAVLAGATAAVGAALLPFYPAALVALIAVGAAVAGWTKPRLGVAIALAAPILPLGNVSKGAALLYLPFALGWLALSWNDPRRTGLAFALGPILAPFGALALLPLLVQPCRGPARRALSAAVGVLAAAFVAAVHGRPLPLTGETIPNIGIGGVGSPTEVAAATLSALGSTSGIVTTAIGLGAAAWLLPLARAHGRFGIAGLGAGTIAFVLLAGPTVAALPIVLGTWALCGVLALKLSRTTPDPTKSD